MCVALCLCECLCVCVVYVCVCVTQSRKNCASVYTSVSLIALIARFLLFKFTNNYNIKVAGCFAYLCVSFSLTVGQIWFSFIVKLLIGPGKAFNYFGGGYRHHPKRNRP